ncbi:Peptidase M12A domain-containing protein [Fusarium keratoplasticum]|uniref:Peptidase M12A domain-containing protein n=1 Tax=Fusarium keratoplasticum TaxID=1328300 RepID=A0ACC0R6A7_9HYPO|nr:Peptidase M12A domain-containing protein [Fusarium keratoplasticum]KAI8664520.1 Peptidase M12A domain-containing protein [Fusarium keratoplasticum]KAI8675895.1 Peptidase M12A domain-containing protein [Fusarium keratoplasticum]
MYHAPRNHKHYQHNANVMDYLVDGFEHGAAQHNDPAHLQVEAAGSTSNHYGVGWGCTQGASGNDSEFTDTLQGAVSNDILNGVTPSSFVWPPEKRRLRVRFLNGSASDREIVTNLVNTHYNTIPMRIKFEFLKPDDLGPSDIRISFGTQSSSCLGTEAEKNPDGPTLWLNMYRHIAGLPGPTRRRLRQADILHEVGHSLGMVHEHQHPDCPAVWNYREIQRKTGWKCAQIYKNYDRSFVRGTKPLPYDPESIMHYPIAPEDTRDGMMFVPHAWVLSEGDRRFLMSLYPDPYMPMLRESPRWIPEWEMEYKPEKKRSGRHKHKKPKKSDEPGLIKWILYTAG